MRSRNHSSLAGVVTAAAAAYIGLRFYSSSQITYVTAAMLSRNLPNAESRIVQVGGGVRELYYYPNKTVQVCTFPPCVGVSTWGRALAQRQPALGRTASTCPRGMHAWFDAFILFWPSSASGSR